MRTIALIAVLAGATACHKSEEPAQARVEPPPDPITATEVERGRQACEHFAEQVCDCALARPEMTSECDLARTRAGAFDLNVRAARASGHTSTRDVASIQANARKIMRACIEDAAKLVVRGCPVSEAAATPGAPAPAGMTARPAAPEPGPDRTR
jgi:hypothetical protein